MTYSHIGFVPVREPHTLRVEGWSPGFIEKIGGGFFMKVFQVESVRWCEVETETTLVAEETAGGASQKQTYKHGRCA